MQEKQLMEHFNFGSGSEKKGQKIKWIRVLVEPTKKSIPNSKTKAENFWSTTLHKILKNGTK